METIGFIGLGLIGGSIAKAIRRIHPDCRMIACDTDKESLVTALSDGTLNETCDTVSSGFSACDILFLCAPVSVNIHYLSALKPILKEDCILTDVGSVKSTIHTSVRKAGLSSHFIGGHPMAGSEKTGYNSAHDRLVENAYYILTPSRQVSEDKLRKMTALISSINAIPIVLDCERHDFITASISHLPHIIAYTLVNLVRESDGPDGMMQRLAAGGFKDITRIASSSPVMWQQICSENKTHILEVLHTYMKSLETIYNAVQCDDKAYMLESFGTAKAFRDDIPKSRVRGALRPIFEIYVDIIDESGAIATIATILATNSISIKNIGIVHNREFQEGVLRIEFYDDDASIRAAGLLRRFHYKVHERN